MTFEPKTHERDEWLLNRMLDGDLSDDEAAVVRDRIEREPQLRAMLDALTRVESLLAERQSDRPRLDWDRFHAAVMADVEAHAAPLPSFPRKRESSRAVMADVEAQAAPPGSRVRLGIRRFPLWIRIAGPLAAAAVVAMGVFLRPSQQSLSPTPGGGAKPGLIVVYDLPTRDTPGPLMVRYHRSDHEGLDQMPDVATTHVAYVRSPELDRHTRESDQAREKQPSWRLYAVHVKPARSAGADLFDAAPM